MTTKKESPSELALALTLSSIEALEKLIQGQNQGNKTVPLALCLVARGLLDLRASADDIDGSVRWVAENVDGVALALVDSGSESR